MPTEKQSAASRANAQHSTGPRTAEGKAASRFNALKHGIFAESQIIFDESAEALADLDAEYRERYDPADAAERCLVDVLIDCEWRLRRLRRVETQTWNKMNRESLDHRRSFAKHPAEVAVPTVGEVFCGDMDKFTAIQKAIASCQRDIRQTLKELRLARHPALRTQQPGPGEVIHGVQPEQTKATSTPSASFPNTPPNPGAEAEPAGHSAIEPIPDLPEAA